MRVLLCFGHAMSSNALNAPLGANIKHTGDRCLSRAADRLDLPVRLIRIVCCCKTVFTVGGKAKFTSMSHLGLVWSSMCSIGERFMIYMSVSGRSSCCCYDL